MRHLLSKTLLVAGLAGAALSSCTKDNKNSVELAVNTKVRLSIQIPQTWTDAQFSELKVVVTNVQTGKAETVSDFKQEGNNFYSQHELQEGNYNIVLSGKVQYKEGAANLTYPIHLEQKNVKVARSTTEQTIALVPEIYNASSDFVISEIYYMALPQGGTSLYNRAQYIRITNNSNETLYADGLAFLISKDLTQMKRNLYEPYQDTDFFAGAIYVVPGEGKTVPVEAGKSLTIALNAKDHSTIDKRLPDLSHADFEIFDKSSNPKVQDEDNGAVKNLNSWFKESLTFTTLHVRGGKSYALARIKMDEQTFLKEKHYVSKYKFVFKDTSKDMQHEGYKVPNEWIVDAVNTGLKDEFEWNIVSPKLDQGFTYCFNKQTDKNTEAYSVIRRSFGGKLIDTNNSTNDFLPLQKPTLVK